MASYLDIAKRSASTNSLPAGRLVPLKPPHPTARFLELYQHFKNPRKPKTPRKVIGELKLFCFRGVFSGCYTDGCAVALASTKEDAIEYILEEIVNAKNNQELAFEFVREVEKSYNITIDGQGEPWEKSTGMGIEKWYDLVYGETYHVTFGTWGTNRDVYNDAKKELTECVDVDEIELTRPFVMVNGGGD